MKEDESLVRQTLEGHDEAFEELVRRYRDMVYTICHKILDHSGRSEEIAQDVFVKCYRSLSSFKGRSKFSSWLYRIAYNASLDALKKRRNFQVIGLEEVNEDQERISALDHLEIQDRKNIVQDAIDSLDTENRIIVLMYYYEEMSIKEIGQVVGLKPNYVKVKLFRSRKHLSKELEDKLSMI